MKLRLYLALLLLIALTACDAPQPTAPATAPAAAPTTVPQVQPTAVPPTQPPPTDTLAPAATEPPPTEPAPTAPPAPTDTLAPQPTDTAAPAATRPRPTPTSSGPLAAAIYVANCRSAPTAEKPGRIIVQISVEASGGNGRYRYFYQDKESPTKFIEVPGEKGTRVIGEVKVTSGDGQEIKQEFDVAPGQLNCP
jgi:hypothetical protein